MRAITGYKIVALCLFAAPVWAASGSTPKPAAPQGQQRYPYDPVCGWGRIADGHGMLMRCLTEQEASQLGAPKAASTTQQNTVDVPAKETESQPADEGKAEHSTPDDKNHAATDDKESPAVTPGKTEVTVEKIGPVTVDTGDLPLAVKKLSAPKDRYLECVKKNGGLLAERGEVDVRFLVRERGRAEGVSVVKRRGMSEAAAKCIADVVDRRYVGYPAAPIVGVTLPITIVPRK